MKIRSARKGSALLIVLGMCAFMLVSAIAFSAYMRYSRLPSSYLRRTASTRLLVKAALSRAIDAIDRAINNNPHPGVGTMGCGGPNRNIWTHRVFMGTNAWAKVSDTVTPLCLEGLAYIPPPLVNEARFYSRRSPAGQWASLGFDSGRYCYCALDVSDYFDVNRLTANSARSSAPVRRTSFAYIFEKYHTKAPTGNDANEWDTFMEQFRGQADEDTLQFDFKSQAPLISMADFNLALGRKGKVGGLNSPFYDYLKNGGQGAGFYDTNGTDDEDRIRRMTFVTDGLFLPEGDETDDDGNVIKTYDINDGKNQPFSQDYLAADKPALSDCLFGKRLQNETEMKWIDHLSGLGCAALYDYLDPDHVPISLAIPTTERVPMVCGLATDFVGSRFGLLKTYKNPDKTGQPYPNGENFTNQSTAPAASEGQTRECEQTVYYRINNQEFLKGFLTGNVGMLTCFPFAHEDEKDNTFKADGRFTMFFTTGDVSLRTGTAADIFSLPNGNIDNTALVPAKGLLNVKLAEQNVPVAGKTMKDEKEALQLIQCDMGSAQGEIGSQLALEGNEFLRVKYKWTQTATKVYNLAGGVAQCEWKPAWNEDQIGPAGIVEAHSAFPATKWQAKALDGTDPDMASDAALAKFLQGNGSKQLTLRAAVWARVRDKAGKVVDMVPACFQDDAKQNQSNDPYPLMQVIAEQNLGKANPLMLLSTGVTVDFSIAGLNKLVTEPAEITVSPKNMIVADPRYNHAPEHWYKIDKEVTPENWLDRCELGSSDVGRDNDIFMATSDAGYLQSVYELAFIPRFSDLIAGGDVTGTYEPPDGTVLTAIPDSFAGTRNQNLMWKTFDPISDNFAAFEDLPWISSGNGFKVNPYSDSTNVLMAAFANTPIDWKRASTNTTGNVSECAGDFLDDGLAFNKQYAFNEYSSGPKFAWLDLEQVAGYFSDRTRSRADWQLALQDVFKYGDIDRLADFTLDSKTDSLWTADRKFLYGYWHECFASKQQLFLIFVRAEPMMMGGGAVGQIPPQLGGRAVALVWRDPRASKEVDDPHQTRILFYRQFE